VARHTYTSKARRPFEFELDGVEFAATGGMNVLELAELANVATTDADSPAGVQAAAGFFRRVLGKEYDPFRDHCAEHNTDNDTILEIMKDIVEDVMGGTPTKRPSPSSSGRSSTGSTARAGSRSRRTAVDPPAARTTRSRGRSA
jgi:hypothetical protein